MSDARDPSSVDDLLHAASRSLRLTVILASLMATAVGVGVVWLLLPPGLSGWGALPYCIAYFLTSFAANIAAGGIVFWISGSYLRKITDAQQRRLAERIILDPMEARMRACVLKCLAEAGQSGVTEKESVDSVPWAEVIDGAQHTIDVCVQGWDGFIHKHKGPWSRFLRDRQGTVNLILPRPTAANRSILHIAARRGVEIEAQLHEIAQTAVILDEIAAACNAASRVATHYVDAMIWYCLIRVDGKTAYLSFYEHVREGTLNSPVFVMQLDRFTVFDGWVSKELDGLTKKAASANG